MKRILLTLALFSSFAIHAWAQKPPSANALQIAYPGKTWAVIINSPGFTVEENVMKLGGRQYLLANNKKTGMMLAINMQQEARTVVADTCSVYLRRRIQGMDNQRLKDVRYSTAGSMSTGSMAVVEYLAPVAKGSPADQKNLIACAAKEDVYVDIHLSKSQYTAADRQLFASIVEGIRIADLPPAPPKATRP